MYLNGIAKQPWSSQDTETAKALIQMIQPLRCEALANSS